MWKKWKESDFYKKLKQVRVNRAVYLTAVIVLLSLAVVLAITAATNRAKKNLPDGGEITPGDNAGQEENNDPQPLDPNNPNGDSEPTIVEDKIPEFVLPVSSGKLSKAHSVDIQVFSQTLKDYRVHLGIDISTAENAPVCAAADGTVSQIWEDPMMGWCVALTHSGDCVTVYKNMAKTMADGLNIGTNVQKGQLLGYVGDSAAVEIAEEPHLHMEMTVNGLQVNPLEYFSATVASTLSEDTIYETESGK